MPCHASVSSGSQMAATCCSLGRVPFPWGENFMPMVPANECEKQNAGFF